MRPSIGSLSLSEDKDFRSHLEIIEQRVRFASEVADKVSDNQMQSFVNSIETIGRMISNQASLQNSDYVNERDSFLSGIKSRVENMAGNEWSPFAVCMVESLFSERKNKPEEQKISDDLEKQASRINKELEKKEEAIKKELEEKEAVMKKESEERERKISLTAAGVSVKNAQDQFRNAQSDINKKMYIWAGLSAIGIISLFSAIYNFTNVNISAELEWSTVYYSAIKISMLVAIGTITSFFIKMLRAHIYMSEKNNHRIRVANSIEAFVNSATTPEQRDLILSQLVDSVIQFGASGLLNKEEDNIYRPKMTFDSIMRTISTKPPQE